MFLSWFISEVDRMSVGITPSMGCNDGGDDGEDYFASVGIIQESFPVDLVL
jgi:hypothetical protein